MSTRGIIGVQHGDTWRGVYNHSDSYPTWLGRDLWKYLRRHGAEQYRRLIEATPQGFSTFDPDGEDAGRDGQPFGAYAPKGHPDYQGDMLFEDGCGAKCAPETCDALSIEWIYALSNSGRYLTILGSYATGGEPNRIVFDRPNGTRADFEQAAYAHRYVAQVDLEGDEPDWQAIEKDHSAWRAQHEGWVES